MMRALLCLALAALAGCATEPVPADKATYARAVLNPSLTKPEPGKVAYTFKRDTGGSNSFCSFRVFVNGAPLADLDTGETVTAYLAPGDYIIGARTNGICMAGNAESEITAKPGVARTYRIGVDAGGSLRVQPTSF